MTASAIVLMVIALVTVWGGLLVTSFMLAKRPQARGGWADHPEIDRDDDVDD